MNKEVKDRVCLWCTRVFLSTGPGNRKCVMCRKSEAVGDKYAKVRLPPTRTVDHDEMEITSLESFTN